MRLAAILHLVASVGIIEKMRCEQNVKDVRKIIKKKYGGLPWWRSG